MTTTSSSFLYQGSKTSQISFPLGGIGSGSIGLAGNGRLIDWEIFNRPNKGSVNGFSHFAIRAEEKGKVISARILHGDLTPCTDVAPLIRDKTKLCVKMVNGKPFAVLP